MMKTSIKRRSAKIALVLAAACMIGAAIAAAPGPTARGQFYYYLNASGTVVGYRAIDCSGKKVGWGTVTSRYADGWMICDPIQN